MRAMRHPVLALAAALVVLSACAARAPSAPGPAPAAATVAAPSPQPVALPDRPWGDEVLYFVLVDRFADGDRTNDEKASPGAPGAFHGGDLTGLTQHLDEIASLGVTAIWVNPLVRNIPGYVSGAGFPDWGYHGYWADDYGKVDPRFGTEESLRSFVDACHARGIRVLLDVVYNHPGYDSHFVFDKATRDWLRSGIRGDCGEDDLTSCVAGLPDWKTELPEVRDFLLGQQIPWAKRFGLDGFRLDTLKHVDHDFWQIQRRRLRAEVSPTFFLLGELWGGDRESLDAYFAADEIDAGFDFTFQGNTVGWILGRGRTIAYERYLEQRHKVRAGHYLAHFLSSHDVTGALKMLGGDLQAFRLAAILQLTTLGIPTIFYGEEVGRDIGDWPANRSDMPWGDRDILPGKGKPRSEPLRDLYRKVIAVRRAHPALSRGDQAALSVEGDVLVFARRLDRDAVVVAVNRGRGPARVRVTVPQAWAGAAVSDVLTGEAVDVHDGSADIALDGRTARILAPAAEETPR